MSDDHRRPIDNLKPDEVEIFEDGNPVVLQALRHIGPGDPSLLSILIDSGSNESVSLAQNSLSELLSATGDANFQASVWDTKRGALLLDFRSDKKALADALQNPGAFPEADVSAKSKRILALARRLMNDQRTDPWFSVLFALIAEQGDTAGRKEIVFFAPYGGEGGVTETQVAALASNALRAGVTVYIAETGGVGAQAEAKAAVLLTGHKKQAAGSPNVWRELAEKTGGLYVAASKENVRDLLRQSGENLRSYYEATVQGSPESEDGHFRAIAARTTRPHADVRYGAGYFSAPRVCGFDLADYEIPMLEALHGGAHDGQLAFDSQIFRFGQHAGKTKVDLVVEIPRSTLTSVEGEAERLLRMHFSVYAQIRSSDGRVVERFSEDVPYETAGDRAAAGTKNLFTFERSLMLPAGEYTAEVALADRLASNFAHRVIPFSIARAGTPVTLGDLVLIRGVESAAASDPDNPLRFGSGNLIPWAGSDIPFNQTADLPVLLRIYIDPATGEPPELQLEILHDQNQIANLPLLLSGGNDGEYQALVWLPEASLAPGRYTLVAHGFQAQIFAEQRRDFNLVPSGASEILAAASGPEVSPQQLLSPPPDLIAGAKRPSDSEIDAILRPARKGALDFKRGLPNFSCVQITKRFISKTGTQHWKLKDTITELVRYNAGKEQHQLLEVNGRTRAIDIGEVKGLITKGEFGEFLDAVFSPSAHAEFTWQGLTLVDGRQAQSFAYKVKRANSIYSLSTQDGRSRVNSAFHGIVNIDVNTLTARYVSIEAEDIPAQSLYREATVSVNYGYVSINGERFLLPKTAVLSVRVGKRLLYKDDMEFRDYHRYGATSGLVGRSPTSSR